MTADERARALAIYHRACPHDTEGPDPDRDADIAAEMIAIRDAPNLDAAVAVIEWWGEDEPGELRKLAARVRRMWRVHR